MRKKDVLFEFFVFFPENGEIVFVVIDKRQRMCRFEFSFLFFPIIYWNPYFFDQNQLHTHYTRRKSDLIKLDIVIILLF